MYLQLLLPADATLQAIAVVGILSNQILVPLLICHGLNPQAWSYSFLDCSKHGLICTCCMYPHLEQI